MGPVIATLRARTARVHFRLPFAVGKIRGTRRMRSHVSAHRASSKYFSNSFVFKTEIEKEGLPRDSTPDLGAGGPEFKSRRPDQPLPCLSATLNPFHYGRIPAVEPPPKRDGPRWWHGQLERTARPWTRYITKAATGWRVPAPTDGSVSHQKRGSKKCIGSQFPPRKLHRSDTRSILKLSRSNLNTEACISFLMCLRMSSMD